MKENLFDALEECLAALQEGKDIESCLARHPGLINELRPLLAAAVEAQSLAIQDAPVHVMSVGKAQLLNQAAEMRERDYAGRKLAASPLRTVRRSLRLALATLVVAIMTFTAGGIGLVYASASALPGDRLYPIKIGWEGAQLKLASNPQTQQELQAQFEQERVYEVDQLIVSGRAQDVDFIGTVTAIFPDRLMVSGIKVLLGQQTKVEGKLDLNDDVRVEGKTQPDGAVLATEIKVLKPVPQNEEAANTPGSGAPTSQSNETPRPTNDGSNEEATPGPQPTSQSQQSFDLEGSVSSLTSGTIVVDGYTIILTNSTEIRGNLANGVSVRVRGTIASNGSLIATRVEVKDGGGGGEDGGTSTVTPASGGGSNNTATPTPASGGDDDHGTETPSPTPTPSSGGGGG